MTEVGRRVVVNSAPLASLGCTVVTPVRISSYQPEMAPDVASLIHEAFAEHRTLPPLNLLRPPAPYLTVEELSVTLEAVGVQRDASFVVLEDDVPVSAAIAVRDGDDVGWWRVATARAHRRRGLARRCIEAGERALRRRGVGRVVTTQVVDGRWQDAAALWRALSYRLDDPQHRNTTMRCDGWRPREVSVAAGHELATLTDADVRGWTECRNGVFGGDVGPDWLRRRFMSRPDFDPSGWYLVKHDGRVVGISGALDIQDERDPQRLSGGMIEYVGVLAEYRGLGLGEALVVACLNWLAKRGADPVLLVTQPFRVPAVRLYEKLGFRTMAAWHRYVKDLG